MKIQVTINNHKSIKVYKLLESKMKSKAIERALLLLVEDEKFAELFFGHQNYKKAISSVKAELAKNTEGEDTKNDDKPTSDNNKQASDGLEKKIEMTDWD